MREAVRTFLHATKRNGRYGPLKATYRLVTDKASTAVETNETSSHPRRRVPISTSICPGEAPRQWVPACAGTTMVSQMPRFPSSSHVPRR